VEQIIFEEDKPVDPCVPIHSENICGVFTKQMNELVFTPQFCKYT
jgi:hypothetical protein